MSGREEQLDYGRIDAVNSLFCTFFVLEMIGEGISWDISMEVFENSIAVIDETSFASNDLLLFIFRQDVQGGEKMSSEI